jgi:hypothetical protein
MDRAVSGTPPTTVRLISRRRSAEDFRPQDGQSLLARIKHAKKYAKEADKALQNIEVVDHARFERCCSRLSCRPSSKRDTSSPVEVRDHRDLFLGTQCRAQTL